MSDKHFALSNTTTGNPPRLPFLAMKNAVLGARYDLSVGIVGDTRSRTLNRTFRGSDKPANVLSFPLSHESGEIVLCLKEARRGAKHYDMPYRSFVGYLFIHGLLHLKGRRHGVTMEKEEEKLMKKFRLFLSLPIHGTKYRSRYRRRHTPGQGRDRRGAARSGE